MAKKKVAKIEIIDAGSAPDVDSDFQTEYREKAIEHVAETYGKDNVANIVTFGTLAGKAAFKQMCTIYEVNFALANKITALYPPMIEGVSATLEDIYNPDSSRYAEGADFREAVSGKEWEKVIAGARAIEGRNKNTGVHACFVAGTLIKTSEGYKNIEDITVGDIVLTHTNSYKEVMDTMVNEDGEIFYLQAANSIPSKVTGEHPFYTRSIIRKNGGKIRELSEPVWKNVDELVVGDDLIGTPVNQKSTLPDNSFNLPFEDPDFWWIAGRFLGDGWCEEFMSIRNRQRKDGTPYEYNRQEKNLVISVGYNDPTRSIFEEKLGKLFEYRTSAARTTVKFYVHGSDVFEYFKTFGKYAVGKRVPDEVLDLPVNLLRSFAEGYFSADGHYSKSNDRQSFSSVSRELALSMIAVVNKVYKTHCSVVVSKRDQMVIEGRTVDCHDKYQISFKENLEAKTRSFYEDGYIWAGLSKIVKIDDDELTYNFSVLDDNSYIANGLAVHNCGIIISNVPLSEAIPLHVRQKDQRTITQWTYPECESLGLLKMDFLGLDTVDLVQNAVKNILKSGKEAPNMIDLIHGPMDDPEVYKLFQRGETVGVFQFGSEMVQQLLHLTKPTEFADLPAITSVARPGPMGMQSHTKYADRKNGREEIDYIHPEFKGTVMEEILGKTYGLCIPAGTPILDSTTGKYVPIEKLVPNESMTPSYNHSTGKFENKTVLNVLKTGNKKVLRITLNGNRTFTVSDTHPILTSRGYVEAGKLTESDRVVVKSQETDIDVEASISEDRAYFLGAMLGDGSFTSDNQPYLTNNDESIIEEVVRIAETEFDEVYAEIKVRQNQTHPPVIMFRNYPIGERANYRHLSKKSSINKWFAELGYEQKVLMYDKYISEKIFNQPNSVLRNTVAGLWDTDGTVSKSAVHFTTTSEKLHISMKQALDRLGVDYGIIVSPYENKIRKNRIAYRIYPVYKDFEEKIQPYLRSFKRKESLLGRTNIASNGFTYFYDTICEGFYKWMEKEGELENLSESGLTHAKESQKIGWKSGRSYLNNRHNANITTRIGFTKYVVENNMLEEKLKHTVSNRYRRVLKIEEHGFADCYDIEVADNHNFVVEGVVVHNCIYQEQVQQISNRIAGMTLQEGDDLRRAMGKKKKAVMDEMRPKFYEGAMKNGFSEEAITQLWDTLEPFAKYGFNKCLYGRTMVSLPEGEGKISIEKLYERFLNGEKDIQILSMFEDGEIRPHTVKNIVQTGVKPLYKIKTKSGRIIRLTKEHRLLTPGGYGTIEDGVLTIGQELIVDAEWTKRLSEETRLTRQRTMSEVNRSDEQREKARERMVAYQKSLSFADRSAHQQQIQLNSPQRSVKPLRAMQERLSYLRKNDLEWQKQVLENSQKWFEETSAIRKGYGIPTVLSDGRVADSIAEAAAAEYLLSRGIDFEMHKVFTSVHGTAKITDFYVDGLYFEMDGLRRGREYFVKEKYGAEIPFVYLTPDNFGDEIDNALMKHHIENGDEIVEIIEPKVLENGSILREMTYDIEMDTTGPANFIANGIVSHNSHAVAYAMNSYQSAYLKAHYPVEFMSALIAQHVGDKNKTLMYLRDAKRMGLKVGSVDVNLSETRVAPNYAKKNNDDYDIIFGLAGVQSVSSDMATIIIEEREKNGHYTSVKDLVDRCMPLGVDKRTVYENLALAGAFDCFGVSRKLAFENVVNLVDGSKVKAKNGDSLFEMFDVEDDSLEIDLFGEDYPFLTKLKKEAGMVGLYLTAHPTDKVSTSLSGGSSHTIAKLLSMSGGRPVRTTMIASVLGIETKRSKRGAKSMLLDLDDGTGFMNVYLSKQIVSGIEKFNAQQTIRTAYEKGKTEVKEEVLARAVDPEVKVVKDIEKYDLYMFDITYRAGNDENPYRVQVNSLKPLQLAGNGSLPVRIRYRLTDNNAEKIAKLERALPYNLEKKMPGDYPIYTTTYSENDLFVDDAVLYSTACKIMASSEEGEERVWPPAVKKTKAAQPSQEDIIQAIENLEYTDSGYTTDKSQRVEQAIEKYVGYGAYDFGIFNPESLED